MTETKYAKYYCVKKWSYKYEKDNYIKSVKNRIQEHTPISLKYEMKGRINTLSETVFFETIT